MIKYTYEEALKASLEYFKGNELAAKVFIDKYALRNGEDELLEDTPDKMHCRLAKEFARIEKKKFKEPFAEEFIYNLLKDFQYIIPAGSPMYGMGNNYVYVTLSNCYLCNIPMDAYNSILDVDRQFVNLSKRRGGTATDLSQLRPKGTHTKNSSKSSTGITSWMERYSNSMKECGQNSRRGAALLSLSVHHPDILDFCTIKTDLEKVTGANVSVKLSEEFIDALLNNKEYELRFPVGATIPDTSKMIFAQKVWDTIVDSSWGVGDPGILNWPVVQRETPSDCYEEYKAEGTNACCFSVNQDVWVITKNGYKELKTITRDDLIWCDVSQTFEKTSGYFSAGLAQTYIVCFDTGKNLIVTENHKLGKYDDTHWRKTGKREIFLTKVKDLNVDDFVHLNIFDPITGLYSEFYVSRITAIAKNAIEEVGCIEVENTHYFSANGIISGNSELILSPLESCRLMSLNLLSYVDDPFTYKASIDFDTLREHSIIIQRLMDDLVDLESEKIDLILQKIESDPEPDYIKEPEKRMWLEIKRKNDEGRRTGVGITGLGDLIAALGLKYGSNRSIEITDEVYRTIKLGCYRSSVDMAKELGAFKVWDYNKEKSHPFLLRMKDEDPVLYNDMTKYGRRNIALLATAPTGTLSLLTQTTSGIEPLFEISHVRRRKINPEDDNIRVDFTDQNGDKWQNYQVFHPQVKTWQEITGETDLTKSPWYGCCANDIDFKKKIKLISAAQKHTCHNISCTFNLPSTATKEDIDQIYRLAIEYNLKGVTVYRDGSRSGVLVKNVIPKERPKELECDVHHVSIKGHPFMVLVGLVNNQPYEVFAIPNGDSKAKSGTITKMLRPKYYKATLEDGLELSPINSMCNDYEDAITRLVSVGLQNNTDPHRIVQQLEKVKGDISGFAKSISRALKKYIKDGTDEQAKCPECGGKLVRISGCPQCQLCSYSKCL